MELSGYEKTLIALAINNELEELRARIEHSPKPERIRPLLRAYEKLYRRIIDSKDVRKPYISGVCRMGECNKCHFRMATIPPRDCEHECHDWQRKER
jgi:hypothetical protein